MPGLAPHKLCLGPAWIPHHLRLNHFKGWPTQAYLGPVVREANRCAGICKPPLSFQVKVRIFLKDEALQ
jgi:hypothetical protein